MFYTIYKITNQINNKIYIGKHQTKDLNDNYMGSGKHLKHAIKKYGIENFKKEILFRFDNEVDMNAKEAELVTEEFCLRKDTYNICVGGQGGFGYINNEIWTKDDRLYHNSRVSGLKKENGFNRSKYIEIYIENGKNLASIRKAKNIKPFLGKNHTEEWKQNHSNIMKEKSKGSKNSQYGTMWITNGQENKKIKKDIDIIPEGWYKGRK